LSGLAAVGSTGKTKKKTYRRFAAFARRESRSADGHADVSTKLDVRKGPTIAEQVTGEHETSTDG